MDSCFAPAELTERRILENQIESISSNPIMNTLMKATGSMLVVLNETRQIVGLNEAFLKSLGLGDAAKIMVIFVAAFVPSVINSYTGVRQIERPIFEASAMLKVTGWRYWREVLIPGALPSIFTGLRLSLQASWTTLVAAELVGAVTGLGQILNQAAQDIFPAMILVGMASVALCGWLMTMALGWIERRVMPWKALA